MKLVQKLALLCLFALILSGCTSRKPDPQATPDPFQTAMDKARQWEEKKIWGLAEAEVRKALAIDATSLEARQFLFVTLSNQPERPEATKEAMVLAKELESSYEEGSLERQKLVTYQEAETSKQTWSALTQAVKEKKPNVEQLLGKIPESQRNDDYWRLASEFRKDNPDLKTRMDTFRQWLKFDPEGIEASAAAKELQRYDLGMGDSAKVAFQRLVEADPADRAIFSSGDKWRLEALDTILSQSRILEVKEAKGGNLDVAISFVNPYLKKPSKETLTLVYRKTRGAYILDSNRSYFGTAMTLLGDPAQVMASNLSGIEGIFNSSTITDLAPLENAYGAGQAGKFQVRFDHGRLLAHLDKKSSKLTSIELVGPGYRTREGLGIGSSLNEFAAYHKVEEKL